MAQPNRNQNLSSDDTEAERQAKLDAAAERERKAAEEAAEEKRKADEKAAKEAQREAERKPTAAHPQVSAGVTPPADDPEKTSMRPAEVVKAGQSGKGAGVRSTKLSRRDMEDVIKQGGSVMYKGQILTHVGHLPPASELAAGDEEAEKAVAAELQRQRDAIDAQLSKLRK